MSFSYNVHVSSKINILDVNKEHFAVTPIVQKTVKIVFLNKFRQFTYYVERVAPYILRMCCGSGGVC